MLALLGLAEALEGACPQVGLQDAKAKPLGSQGEVGVVQEAQLAQGVEWPGTAGGVSGEVEFGGVLDEQDDGVLGDACEGGVAAALSLAAGERVGSLILVGIPLALVGVVLVSSSGGGGRGGVLPAATAALLWGGVLALSAPLAGELGVIWAFVLVRLCAVALMAPLAVARGVLAAARTQPWPVVAWGVGDAVAYFAFVIAADRGPASVAGVLAAQFGTVGALVAVFFFGERLRRRQQVGLALVAVAVALMAAAVG